MNARGRDGALRRPDAAARRPYLLMLRFVQLLLNRSLFMTNIAQMALENWQLGLLRIRLVAHRLTLPVLRSGLFCVANLAKQIIFLFLKLTVAGLQGLRAIGGGLLFH